MKQVYGTGIAGYTLRLAEEGDSELIVRFIRELASFESLEHQVEATVEGVRDSVFAKKQAEVLIGEFEGEAVSFAVLYSPFSTFLGGVHFYLEDLYVRQAFRGRGFGTAIFHVMAKLAVERGITRIDWFVLDWNKNAIDFYEKMGAFPMEGWTTYRLNGEALKKVAAQGAG